MCTIVYPYLNVSCRSLSPKIKIKFDTFWPIICTPICYSTSCLDDSFRPRLKNPWFGTSNWIHLSKLHIFCLFLFKRKEVMIFDKHLPLSFIESKIISRFFTILHPSFTLTSFHHPFILHPSFGFCTFQTLSLARATPQGFSTEGSNHFGIQLAIVLTMCVCISAGKFSQPKVLNHRQNYQDLWHSPQNQKSSISCCFVRRVTGRSCGPQKHTWSFLAGFLMETECLMQQ